MDRGHRETLIRTHFLIVDWTEFNYSFFVVVLRIESRLLLLLLLLSMVLLLHGALNAALDGGVLGSRLLLLLPLPRMFICVVNNSKQIKKRNATFLLLQENTTLRRM